MSKVVDQEKERRSHPDLGRRRWASPASPRTSPGAFLRSWREREGGGVGDWEEDGEEILPQPESSLAGGSQLPNSWGT